MGVRINAMPPTQAELPALSEIKAAIPKYCFERSTATALCLLARCTLLVALVGLLGWDLPSEQLSLLDWTCWHLYWFAMGVVATGHWVLAHECGHGALFPSAWANDGVGFLLHSALLVPYFSWQYSHRRHHSKTNHIEDGETHVPPLKDDQLLPH